MDCLEWNILLIQLIGYSMKNKRNMLECFFVVGIILTFRIVFTLFHFKKKLSSFILDLPL